MLSSRRTIRFAIVICALATIATAYAGGFTTNYHYDNAGNLLLACTAGTDSCDGNVGNGCETNLVTDVRGCGSCGHACSQANASESCVNGSCVLNSCTDGFANCDSNIENGCEASLVSLSDCGSCGVRCGPFPNGVASCSTRTCQLQSCNAGYANCDGAVANGCEVPLSTLTDCGSCGVRCGPLPNATATCSNQTCRIQSCNAGYADCDGIVANGCESSLSSLTTCGSCGVQCAFPNGSASCSTRTCQFLSCNAGYANCDGAMANGCEASLMGNVRNCGACGRVCAPRYGCIKGTCQPPGPAAPPGSR